MRLSQYVTGAVVTIALAGALWGQLGGLSTQEWSTSGGDAQRSGWIRKDFLISPASMATGKFGLLWKLKLNNQARQMHYLSHPMLVNNAMGYKGFRSLTMLSGPENKLFAVDNDFGEMYWEKQFEVAVPRESSGACPGGSLSASARAVNPDPASLAGRGPVVRSPYRGVLGEPGAGVVESTPPAGAAGRGGAGGGRGGAGAGRGGGRGRSPAQKTGAQLMTTLTSDGVLHFVSPITAKELLKPVPFLPANARATDLTWVNDVVYAATVGGCGGVPNAVWAVDMSVENPQAVSWPTNGGSVVGNLAFGSDGTLFAAIGEGQVAAGGYANAVVALDPKTLAVKDWIVQTGAGFASSPVVFQNKGKDLLAEVATDGRVFLMDAAVLGGVDHKTPLQITPASAGPRGNVRADGLASWESPTGTRWLLVSSAAPAAAAGFPSVYGAITNGAVTAWRLKPGSQPALEAVWVSRDMVAPLPPIVVNGVIYAAASGEYLPGDASISNDERERRSSPAVLYALEAATGKVLWNSGSIMSSYAHGTGLSSSPGQVYLATADNTVYGFGMPYERQ